MLPRVNKFKKKGKKKKDGEFTCFDDVLIKIKNLCEFETNMISEIITICKLLLVNPAKSAAGESSFSTTQRLKM